VAVLLDRLKIGQLWEDPQWVEQYNALVDEVERMSLAMLAMRRAMRSDEPIGPVRTRLVAFSDADFVAVLYHDEGQDGVTAIYAALPPHVRKTGNTEGFTYDATPGTRTHDASGDEQTLIVVGNEQALEGTGGELLISLVMGGTDVVIPDGTKTPWMLLTPLDWSFVC